MDIEFDHAVSVHVHVHVPVGLYVYLQQILEQSLHQVVVCRMCFRMYICAWLVKYYHYLLLQKLPCPSQ